MAYLHAFERNLFLDLNKKAHEVEPEMPFEI